MKMIFAFFIFCFVLFFYLHIQFHLKQSDDLEMYEIENPSKDRIEEICDLRQPVLFDFDNEKIIETTNRFYLEKNYPSFDMKIRNTQNNQNNQDEFYVPLPLHSSVSLLREDPKSCYFTENNMEFLQETGVIKNIQYNDSFLRPYMMSNYYYDVLFGSENTTTPLRYEINYRNFFVMTRGTVKIKMTPPKSSRYLYPNYDYEHFEWSSPLNVWDIQPQYKADFDKIKCLEFTLVPGKTLFIPAYWWYSIRFSKDASITCLKYRTYINNLAISPYLFMYALQIQNIKRETTRKISLEELDQENGKKQNVVEKEKDNDNDKEVGTTKIEDLLPSLKINNV